MVIIYRYNSSTMDCTEGLKNPLTITAVQNYVDSIECDQFGPILADIQGRQGRQLPRKEKGFITSALRCKRMRAADRSRGADSLFSVRQEAPTGCGNILMITAYSDDYTIGSLCEKVNRAYATKHGYEFLSEVLPLAVISEAIAPKKHCAWYKILLMKKLFADPAYLESNNIQYVAWIDADAVVVDHSVRLTDIIHRCGGRDLIIAEDMNTGCLINTGVFMLRTTQWSRDYIDEVWECTKYDEVTFYEQSTMMRILRARKEDLDSVSPFHSYAPGGVQGVKLFPHTAVLPLSDFNSNRGILCNDVRNYEAFVRSVQGLFEDTEAVTSDSAVEGGGDLGVCSGDDNAAACLGPHHALTQASMGGAKTTRRGVSKKLTVPNLCYQASGNFCTLCQRTVGNNLKRAAGEEVDTNPSLFVFHPAGMPDKLNLLYTALLKYNVPYDLAGELRKTPRPTTAAEGVPLGDMGISALAPAPLRLVRGKMGQIPQADQPHLLSRMNKQS